MKIDVWITNGLDDKSLTLNFNPLQRLWDIKERTIEELNQDLKDVVDTYLNQPMNDKLKRTIKAAITNVLHRWINNGWLFLPDPMCSYNANFGNE